MLRIAKLRDAEYVLEQVAGGLEDYYLGGGEAPGVWAGMLAAQMGLAGVVEPEVLRALIEGRDPDWGDDLGLDAKRKVAAFDGTYSAPKSVSLLWAFGDDETSAQVSIAHVEAVATALSFLEERAATARQQIDGVRTAVATTGLAAATFVHRTSREGDPQLHTHCVIPNLVLRADGTYVCLDAQGLYHWARAAGCIYQEELRLRLSERLGVAWGPDHNGCRELLGFEEKQLRTFSKRSIQIEEHLAAKGQVPTDPAARMRADEAASLATRRAKDRSLTPERLRARWEAEAAEVGLSRGKMLAFRLRRAAIRHGAVGEADLNGLFARLVDPELGVCAADSRFTEADVVEAVASFGAGQLSARQVQELAAEFLRSDHVVRLIDRDPSGRTPPRWSTVAHRAVEDRVLDLVAALSQREAKAVAPAVVAAALATRPGLGDDQASAVRVLCGEGPSLRCLIAAAGHGKTTALGAAADAAARDGRRVLALASTNQAVAELGAAGLHAKTIARFAAEGLSLPNRSVVIVDELSQLPTAEADVVLAAVARASGVQLWLVGDPLQAQPVRAGGLAPHLARMAERGRIPAATLSVNRRQRDGAERAALAHYREGEIARSQALRDAAGLEHDFEAAGEARAAMAGAVLEALRADRPEAVAALAVSHADCEDLADRIRAGLADEGLIGGPALEGPGWAGPRAYQAGDRILLHVHLESEAGERVRKGTTATVLSVTDAGMTVRPDGAERAAFLAAEVVVGRGFDGRPNLSHAWARTIDGVQGSTFAQVHLLGTEALDRYRGYVGQSRSTAPTHTWNARAIDDGDHGGHLVGSGHDAAAEVLMALERTPTKTFAAYDDPARTIRRLEAEASEHRRMLVQAPALPAREWGEAMHAHAAAQERVAEARDRLEREQATMAAVSGAARLRRAGRDRYRRAVRDLERLTAGVARDEEVEKACRQRVDEIEEKVAACRRFGEAEGWRRQRLADVERKIDRHWTNTVVAAARVGDPWAFGVDRLKAAISFLRRRTREEAAASHERGSRSAVAPTEKDLVVLERAERARQAAVTFNAPPVIRPQRNRDDVSIALGVRHRQADHGMELGL